METKTLSNKTFSNNSFENWQSQRCDFCMYHQLIFDQLQRLKQAVMLKNQRITELQQFISRLSHMAFMKPAMSQSTNSNTNFVSPQINESSVQFQNDSLLSNKRGINPAFLKRKFDQSSEISFSDSKHNTAKFETKIKQNWPELNSRLQKINQLNEMKRQISRRISQGTMSKCQSKDQHRQSSVNSSTTNEYDTMRSLSLPQEEGPINLIPDSSCESSRVKELSHRNKLTEDQQGPISNQFKKSQSSKRFQQESKNSMNIIKQYIKMLK